MQHIIGVEHLGCSNIKIGKISDLFFHLKKISQIFNKAWANIRHWRSRRLKSSKTIYNFRPWGFKNKDVVRIDGTIWRQTKQDFLTCCTVYFNFRFVTSTSVFLFYFFSHGSLNSVWDEWFCPLFQCLFFDRNRIGECQGRFEFEIQVMNVFFLFLLIWNWWRHFVTGSDYTACER